MTSFEFRGPVQPGAGPLQRLMAPEFSGKIIDPLKQDFVRAAERTALSVKGIRQDLHALGWGIDTIADAVVSLEHQIVPRFDIQIQYLSDQLSVLRSIDSSLKNQRRVQAAERIEQTAYLLGVKQYDRAFAYACEAIEHDATNPGGFIAAGWAFIGSNRIVESINYFMDATSVAKNYEPWVESMRQLARCQLATGDTNSARKNLDQAISYSMSAVQYQKLHVEKLEAEHSYHLPDAKAILESRESDLAALHYDASIAAVAGGNIVAAMSYIEAAVRIDERFAKLAVGDPLFEGCESVPARALRIARRLEKEEEEEEKEEERQQKLAQKEAGLPRLLQRHKALEKTLEAIQSPFLISDEIRNCESRARFHLNDFLKKANNIGVNLESLTEILDKAKMDIEKLLRFWLGLKPSRSSGKEYYKQLKQHKEKVNDHQFFGRYDP